jgi:hypothetical protein
MHAAERSANSQRRGDAGRISTSPRSTRENREYGGVVVGIGAPGMAPAIIDAPTRRCASAAQSRPATGTPGTPRASANVPARR